MTLDVADLRRRAERCQQSMVILAVGPLELLALIALAEQLKAALGQADAEMGCDRSGEYAHDPDVMKGPCPGCAAEIAVRAALDAAKEVKL